MARLRFLETTPNVPPPPSVPERRAPGRIRPLMMLPCAIVWLGGAAKQTSNNAPNGASRPGRNTETLTLFQ
jgi:hypothetical protein